MILSDGSVDQYKYTCTCLCLSLLGARRFVILDFGKPIVLTDVIIPACADLASLSIDVWVQGEEIDGQRLTVASDIGLRSLVMNDIMPATVCRYLKVCKLSHECKNYIENTVMFKHLIAVLISCVKKIYKFDCLYAVLSRLNTDSFKVHSRSNQFGTEFIFLLYFQLSEPEDIILRQRLQ